MLPPDGIVRAAERWLRLLQRAPLAEAAEILRADPAYADLTTTQYALGLDWLRELGLVNDNPQPARAGADHVLTLFRAALEFERPLWLEDADTLVRTADDIPGDALGLAGVLDLDDADSMAAIRQAHGKVDLERRDEVGAIGEAHLVALLERLWPGSTRHVSEHDDGLGYDIELELEGRAWKLEVKSTTRWHRLRIFLSRNEFEVGSLLSDWRLVVLGLGDDMQIEAVVTVPTPYLHTVVPQDTASAGRWASASVDLAPEHVRAGLPFVSHSDPLLLSGRPADGCEFKWVPGDKPEPAY